MVETRADRLRRARRNAGFVSASEAARSLGVSPSTYIHHENGTRDFGEDAAAIYARRYHVSLPWLLLGEGDMTSPELTSQKQKEKSERDELEREERAYRATLSKEDREEIAKSNARAAERRAAEILSEMAVIPCISPTFSRVLTPRQWVRNISLTEQVGYPVINHWGVPPSHLAGEMGCHPKETVLFEITGTANAPTLAHGDQVFINTAIDDLIADGLYLIADGMEYLHVRRLQMKLYSDPPSASIIADGTPDATVTIPISTIKIVGKVVGKISRM